MCSSGCLSNGFGIFINVTEDGTHTTPGRLADFHLHGLLSWSDQETTKASHVMPHLRGWQTTVHGLHVAPPAAFVNKILSEHSHIHSSMYMY